jgi:hypothetical protein
LALIEFEPPLMAAAGGMVSRVSVRFIDAQIHDKQLRFSTSKCAEKHNLAARARAGAFARELGPGGRRRLVRFVAALFTAEVYGGLPGSSSPAGDRHSSFETLHRRPGFGILCPQ